MPPFSSISRRPVLLLLPLAAGWTFWETASAVSWALKTPEKQAFILRYTAVDGGIGLVVCTLLFLLFDRVRDRLELGPFLGVVAPLCYGAAVVWHLASMYAVWWLSLYDQLYLNAKNILVAGGLMDGITLGLFSMLFLAVDHWLQLRTQREKAREAESLAQRAQLQMLRYQLNPHFLFNSLNSIRAMILREPDRARQIVTELSEFLRYSLNGRGPESTVGEEMQAIGNYLAIQRIRFEEKLVVATRVDPAIEGFVLPCFLVHPLVENAVKYGMETCEPPLQVEIEVAAQGADVCIRVSNTGRLLPPAAGGPGGPCDGTGTGLRNVVRRLELAFPGRHAFAVRERDGWVHAEISLRPAAPEVRP
jgi:signal transduction histidine kinase